MEEPKKKKPFGKPFVKGQVANPKGAGAHCPELRAVRLLSKAQIAQLISLIVENDIEGLKKMKASKDTSALQLWVISIAINGINKGDHHALEMLLNRTIGKVREDVHLSGVTAPQVVLTLPRNGSEVDRDKFKK